VRENLRLARILTLRNDAQIPGLLSFYRYEHNRRTCKKISIARRNNIIALHSEEVHTWARTAYSPSTLSELGLTSTDSCRGRTRLLLLGGHDTIEGSTPV
jgi:hypothetical protein